MRMSKLKKLITFVFTCLFTMSSQLTAFAANAYASGWAGNWLKYNEQGFTCFDDDYNGLVRHSGNAVLHLNDIPYCWYNLYKVWTPFGSYTSTGSRSYGIGPVQGNAAGVWTFQYKNQAQTSVNVRVTDYPHVILNKYRQRIGSVSSQNKKIYTCSDVSGTGLQEIFNSPVQCGTHIHSIHDESKNHSLFARYPSGYSSMHDFSCIIVKHGMEGSWSITGSSSSSSYSYVYTGNVRVAGSGSSWSSNDSQHWRKCEGCGQQTDYANHTWSSWMRYTQNTVGNTKGVDVL